MTTLYTFGKIIQPKFLIGLLIPPDQPIFIDRFVPIVSQRCISEFMYNLNKVSPTSSVGYPCINNFIYSTAIYFILYCPFIKLHPPPTT